MLTLMALHGVYVFLILFHVNYKLIYFQENCVRIKVGILHKGGFHTLFALKHHILNLGVH